MTIRMFVNGIEIPPCTCKRRKSPHWSGDDILRILGRGLMDADRFYFESSGRDDAV